MALKGRQKAAMLLMSLDAATAAELLKGINPELVQELAVELAYLDATGYQSGRQSTQVARQFCNSLQADQELNFKSYLEQMMTNKAGDEQVEHIRTQIKDVQRENDPFASIRLLDSQTIASVLEKEHPRSAAVILSELPPEKSSDVLDLLDQGIRFSAIRRMTTCKNMEAEAKAQIAETVCMRLKAFTTDDINEAEPTRLERFVRKMALIMRKMGKDLRVALLGSANTQKDITGEVMTDDTLVQKITSNLSKRTAAMLDEQAVHLSTVKCEDVEEARKEIIQVLHTRMK